MTEYYRTQLNEGLEFQDTVVKWLLDSKNLSISLTGSRKYQNSIGETWQGIEIKHDRKFRSTGNLWIEVAEKTNANNEQWINSGIYRNDNTWLYLIGDDKTLWFFGKRHLVHIVHKFPIIENKLKTSQGYLLPIEGANFYCVEKLERQFNL